MGNLNRPDRLEQDRRREANKAKALKLTMVLGIVSVIFVLAMMSQVLL